MSLDTSPLTSHANAQRLWPKSPDEKIIGKHIVLTPLKPHHAEALYPSISGEANAPLWTYMPKGPFYSLEDFKTYINQCSESKDTIFWAILSNSSSNSSTQDQKILGHTSHLNISLPNATVEIGHILYTPALQRTVGATEAWFLLAERAFQAGFRRLEWKCNAANEPSRRAALRYGHVFEGVFRQHMIVKGRNRDTAWFSILDGEWEGLRRAIESWMDGANFDGEGRQVRSLVEIRGGEDGGE